MLPRKFRRSEAGHGITEYGYEYAGEAESSGQMDEGSGKQQVATESKSMFEPSRKKLLTNLLHYMYY